MMDARRQCFFVIDTETMDTADTAIVMDLSMIFVNMNQLFLLHFNSDNYNPISFKDFCSSEFVSKISLFPNIIEQKSLGLTASKDSIQFWKDQYASATNEVYKQYIIKMMSSEDVKPSIKETTDEFESFIEMCYSEMNYMKQKPKQAIFLERSGGFDTNKYYNLLLKQGKINNESNLKYWSRREIRTMLACNIWRIPEVYLDKSMPTKYSKEIINYLEKSSGEEFIPHIAINDCLIDAYMIYLLKMTIENFYI